MVGGPALERRRRSSHAACWQSAIAGAAGGAPIAGRLRAAACPQHPSFVRAQVTQIGAASDHPSATWTRRLPVIVCGQKCQQHAQQLPRASRRAGSAGECCHPWEFPGEMWFGFQRVQPWCGSSRRPAPPVHLEALEAQVLHPGHWAALCLATSTRLGIWAAAASQSAGFTVTTVL